MISEVSAANVSGLRDEDGEFQDWIELFNPSAVPAPMLGWFLSDAADNLTTWLFPNVTIPANGFLVVFASGKDRRSPMGRLHTNFKLDRGGEYLALIKPDGVTVASEFAPGFPRQSADVTYGVTTTTSTNRWLATNSPGLFLVPTNNQFSQTWFALDFDAAGWTPTSMGIGYYRSADTNAPPEPGIPMEDATQPGDLLIPTSVNSPTGETGPNAIDNNTATKYLNFDKLNTGFTVTPAKGKSVVVGLRFTSANDAPDRDPTSFILSGANDGKTFQEIARGSIPDFPNRFFTVAVSFTNTIAYSQYKLIFPTIRNATTAAAMQIGEVEFLSYGGDQSVGLPDLIQSNVEKPMFGHGSLYVRLPFVISDLRQVDNLLLRMRYDDGFVAWLNGVEVARANAPANPSWAGLAPTNRYRFRATQEELFNLNPFVNLLRSQTNILAIQGFNDQTNSPDFLLQAQLETIETVVGDRAYFQSPTPGAVNGEPSSGLVADVEVSSKRDFYDAPFWLALSCPTANATIRYTLDGSIPTEINGRAYVDSIAIHQTTVLRARAFRQGWIPSTPVTHTYLFLEDVLTQRQETALASGFPTNWNQQPADYGLDPHVVGPKGDSFGGKYATNFMSDLESLPALSIVMPLADLFGPEGIYANPEQHGDAWERAASLELLYPDHRNGFQENAGLRVQGGAFRRFDLSLKKSFRAVFREKYGNATLHYPWFGPDATEHFDTITLRANGNDAWPYGGNGTLYMRDAFGMETARALGLVASHSTFVHLYLNGQYWGLYNPVERPDASFSATYNGGDKDSWDAINQDSITSGTWDAWNHLQSLLNQDMSRNENYQRVQGNNPDGSRNPAYENLLNIPNLIDYMILNFWLGNGDWPVRNWWAGRDRQDGDGFHFYPWDTETALDFTGVDSDRTGAADGVARPYAALRTNVDFRMEFADHVYRHFFNDGAFYVNPLNSKWDPAHPENNRPAERFAKVAELVNRAVVGESARWGDQMNSRLWSRDENWLVERDNLLVNYFPLRSEKVLAQFRRAGLYPKIEPPLMNQRGGSVPKGFQVNLSSSGGIIYYTTNGIDPRIPVSGKPSGTSLIYQSPVPINDVLRLKTRVLNGTEWSALNETTFVVGTPRLVLSELHYHPSSPTAQERLAGFTDSSDFEFVELVNLGPGAYDLTPVQFIAGIHFDFRSSSLITLPAGQCVLVVKNRAAFESRYGPGLPVAGEYTGQLDNAGEHLQLVGAEESSIFDFTYRTELPWPKASDGGGPSLEVIDPLGNLNLPSNWRASGYEGGSPGKKNPSSVLVLEAVVADSKQVHLRFKGRAGLSYTIQACDDVGKGLWQTFQSIPPLVTDQTIEIGVISPGSGSVQFFRVATP